MAKLVVGINDLATLHPEVAAEADGWDPSKVLAGTHKKMSWKCKKGHIWEARVADRSKKKTACSYCSNQKVWAGFNDLQTTFPEFAKEANGWDPSTVLAGTHKKMSWKCKKGHIWEASVGARTGQDQGCPFCSNLRAWAGFNDLATLHPDIAVEADGWDPSTLVSGSNKRMSWKCKKGHTWTAKINDRINYDTWCPYCANTKVWSGFNDLKTLFPEVAKEADGWDPAKVLSGSHAQKNWKCNKGHTWRSVVKNRTGRDDACPYCANRKVWSGFNDLKTLFPEIAKEADGWDPSNVIAGSHSHKNWKCNKGHTWKTVVKHRTLRKSNCPYCCNQKVWVGFNDLATFFPKVAAEADGWDPKTITPGSNKKMPWKCKEGHTWITTPDERTGRDKTSCPVCADHGFNPGEPSWFYLLERPGEQQLGITNNFDQRMRTHASSGWIEIEKTGPHPGEKVLETENAFKKWLRKKVGLVPDKTENWYTSKMEVHSLAELKEKSGIETSIF